jgi:transposase
VEKSEAKRSEFLETINSYPQYKLYYIDECGIDRYLYREYGYAPRGVPIQGNISGKKYKRTNIVAAKNCGKIIAPMIYGGTTDSVLFEYWFEHMFLKTIPKHSIAIMDNAAFHRKKKLRELAAKAECELLFLPPYSPDFNPIEKFWAWLKSRLRKLLSCFQTFDDAIMGAF